MNLVLHSSGKHIPPRVHFVLRNLERIHGNNLVVKRVNATEVVFHVRTMPHTQLIRTMMNQTAEIFGEAGIGVSGAGCVLGPPDFQILCALTATADSVQGVELRYLPNMPNRAEYLSGYWFY